MVQKMGKFKFKLSGVQEYDEYLFIYSGTFWYLPHPPIYNPDKPLSKWCPGTYEHCFDKQGDGDEVRHVPVFEYHSNYWRADTALGDEVLNFAFSIASYI